MQNLREEYERQLKDMEERYKSELQSKEEELAAVQCLIQNDIQFTSTLSQKQSQIIQERGEMQRQHEKEVQAELEKHLQLQK